MSAHLPMALADELLIGQSLRMSAPRTDPSGTRLKAALPCPRFAGLLGWTLESIDPEAGSIVVRFEARHEFTNPLGNVQGGLLAAMLDDTMGPALVATLPPGQFAPTLEMKISYFAPASVGPIWGHGRVVKCGRTTAFVEGDLLDAEQHLLASRAPPSAS